MVQVASCWPSLCKVVSLRSIRKTCEYEFGGRGVGRDPAIHIYGCTSFDAQAGLLVGPDSEGAEFAAFHDRRGRLDGDGRGPLQEHGREEHLRRTGNADPDGEWVFLPRRRPPIAVPAWPTPTESCRPPSRRIPATTGCPRQSSQARCRARRQPGNGRLQLAVAPSFPRVSPTGLRDL